MAEPEKQPLTPPQGAVDSPTPPPVPVIVGGVEEYGSSEEFQRAHAIGLAKQKEDEEKAKSMTEKQRVKSVLDKYIAKHSTTKAVRERLKENGLPVNGKNLEVQFEVSDAIAAELKKIKNDLR